MTIKRRHIRMARAAWRNSESYTWGDHWCGPTTQETYLAVYRWHRAANGRKA